MTPSAEYDELMEQYREFHRTQKTFSGNGILRRRNALLDLAASVQATSALDYGCGKGLQYGIPDPKTGAVLEDQLGFPVYKYDPAVPAFDELPRGKFDLVWCTDVLGCVPKRDLKWVIDQIYGFASKAVLISLCINPSTKRLPNGKNVTIVKKPVAWWEEMLHRDRPDLKTIIVVES